MWKVAGIMLFLIILSIYDMKIKEIPVFYLLAGGATAMGYAAYMILTQQNTVGECALALIPGILFLVASYATGKIGYGDAFLLLILGSLLGYRECIAVFSLSLLLVCALSVILLIVRKADKNSRLPYIPFLTLTFALCNLI